MYCLLVVAKDRLNIYMFIRAKKYLEKILNYFQQGEAKNDEAVNQIKYTNWDFRQDLLQIRGTLLIINNLTYNTPSKRFSTCEVMLYWKELPQYNTISCAWEQITDFYDHRNWVKLELTLTVSAGAYSLRGLWGFILAPQTLSMICQSSHPATSLTLSSLFVTKLWRVLVPGQGHLSVYDIFTYIIIPCAP